MLTEEQAKERWCPFVRAVFDKPDEDEIGVAFNRIENCGVLGPTRCIASQCMAWRWGTFEADDAFLAAVRKAAEEIGDTTPSRAKAAKHVVSNRAKYGLPTEPFKGYCGLAGQP